MNLKAYETAAGTCWLLRQGQVTLTRFATRLMSRWMVRGLMPSFSCTAKWPSVSGWIRWERGITRRLEELP